MSAVIGVIPARWGSSRFPGKMLAALCGKPLIQWVWERARRAARLDEILVATDDERIATAVEGFGGAVAMTGSHHASGTDRIAEAVRDMDAEVVINIQGDEPLIDPGLIDQLAAEMSAGAEWDMATAAEPMRDAAPAADPSVVKVVCAADGRALYFSRALIPHVREKDGSVPDNALYLRNIGIYGYRREFLERLVRTPPSNLELAEKLEQLRALHIGARMKVIMSAAPALGVDEPKDIPVAEDALRKAGCV